MKQLIFPMAMLAMMAFGGNSANAGTFCNGMLSSAKTKCDGEGNFVERYTCKGGAFIVFGLCKSVTGGLGAEERGATLVMAEKECANLKDGGIPSPDCMTYLETMAANDVAELEARIEDREAFKKALVDAYQEGMRK